MELELHIDGRKAVLKETEKKGNRRTILVDGEPIEVDVVKVGPAEYSVLYKGKSYNIEVIPGASPKHYSVNTFYYNYGVEVVDAEARYLLNREDAGAGAGGNIIRSPMPGKVVKILVAPGEKVEAGQTVIIVSAMKMESEFKATAAGVVSKIAVAEGDTVDSNQVLVEIEPEA